MAFSERFECKIKKNQLKLNEELTSTLAWLQESVNLWKWVFKNDIFGVKKSDFENEILLVSKNFSAWILITKMGVKMTLRIITKNHDVDTEKGFRKKSISKPYGRATAMPPAWELIRFISLISLSCDLRSVWAQDTDKKIYFTRLYQGFTQKNILSLKMLKPRVS